MFMAVSWEWMTSPENVQQQRLFLHALVVWFDKFQETPPSTYLNITLRCCMPLSADPVFAMRSDLLFEINVRMRDSQAWGNSQSQT